VRAAKPAGNVWPARGAGRGTPVRGAGRGPPARGAGRGPQFLIYCGRWADVRESGRAASRGAAKAATGVLL
jgi:hypothetical protein